jgi:hypothetical protein
MISKVVVSELETDLNQTKSCNWLSKLGVL